MEREYIERVKYDIRINLEYMRPGLKYSKEGIIEALNDSGFAEELVEKHGVNALKAMPSEFAKEFAENNPDLYSIAFERAVEENPSYIRFAPEGILKPEVYINVLKENPYQLSNVPPNIQEQFPEEVMNAVKKMPIALRFMSITLQENYPQEVMDIVQNNPDSFQYMSKTIQEQNPDFAIDIIEGDPRKIQYLSKSIQKENPKVSIEACKKLGGLVRGIPEEVLIENPDFIVELLENELETLEANGNIEYFTFDEIPEVLMENPKIKQLHNEIEQVINKQLGMNESEFGDSEQKDNLQEKSEGPAPINKSKFAQIYGKAKGRLKEAFSKLRNAFNRDRQVGIDDKENANDNEQR